MAMEAFSAAPAQAKPVKCKVVSVYRYVPPVGPSVEAWQVSGGYNPRWMASSSGTRSVDYVSKCRPRQGAKKVSVRIASYEYASAMGSGQTAWDARRDAVLNMVDQPTKYTRGSVIVADVSFKKGTGTLR